MKRISKEKLAALDRLRLKRWRKELLRRDIKWIGHGTSVISAPSDMSFARAYADTVSFFEDLKICALERKPVLRRGRWVTRPLMVDLSTVKRMSITAAVVLAAELHRWRLIHNAALKPKNVRKWSPRIRAMLVDLGLFGLLEAPVKHDDDSDPSDPITVVKIESASKSDAEKIHSLQTRLGTVVENFTGLEPLYLGMFEAAANTIEHAYPDEQEPRFPCPDKRWWATSCFDPNTKNLRFFVYDQGVGIPATLPKNSWWPELLSFAGRLIESDASMIEAAFEFQKSRTGLEHRGLGIAQMADVVERAEGGYMRVFSGHGEVRYQLGGRFETKNHRQHIGGTLVEWSLPCQAFGILVGDSDA